MRFRRHVLIGSAALASLVIGTSAFAATRTPKLSHFYTCYSLKTRIAKATAGSGVMLRGGTKLFAPMAVQNSAADVATSAGSAGPAEYSQTNVQTAGVDEADIVKQDGQYTYHLTRNRLAISDISPATEAKLSSMTDLGDLQAQDMYVDGNRLMVLGQRWDNQIYASPRVNARMMPIWRGRGMTVAQIWDITDRSKPKKLRTVEFDGSLSTSRMINGVAYVVMNAWSPWEDGQSAVSQRLVPGYRDSKLGTSVRPMTSCAGVSYFDPQPTNQFIAVASLPMSGTGTVGRTVILGSSETVYASTDNLYVARQDWNTAPIRDSLNGDTSKEKTLIHKFGLKNGTITHLAKGSVSGHLLNQFSLDEYDGNLRVATTEGYAWDQQHPSSNLVTVLSKDLTPRGKIDGLAPGETIYSARFMGKRGYLVTFKKVDPLFALDLSNPDQPKLLGKLKIPGYSDYLHPMDETHLIGIGKNAVDAEGGNFAWYQGIKMAVFDVTDPEHPTEQWKTEIGDRGTDSPALHDHKAFLYAPSKQLLAIPVLVAQIPDKQKQGSEYSGSQYGDYVFQGAYVYRLTLDKGFELLGKVSHVPNDDAFLKSGSFYFGDDNSVERVQFNGDQLLTFSNNHLQLNHLFDLTKTKSVDYPTPPAPEPGGPIEIMPMMVK